MASLITAQKTGNGEQFAKRIKISRSKLYELLEDFSLMGVQINYSKKYNTFYYANNLKIKVNTPIEIVPIEECQTINGGLFLMQASILKF
ncbi:hypothetical protein [Saccharicrinis fermentans]|nr:hypothetical protein [Saccharicrinis fermentans]